MTPRLFLSKGAFSLCIRHLPVGYAERKRAGACRWRGPTHAPVLPGVGVVLGRLAIRSLSWVLIGATGSRRGDSGVRSRGLWGAYPGGRKEAGTQKAPRTGRTRPLTRPAGSACTEPGLPHRPDRQGPHRAAELSLLSSLGRSCSQCCVRFTVQQGNRPPLYTCPRPLEPRPTASSPTPAGHHGALRWAPALCNGLPRAV